MTRSAMPVSNSPYLNNMVSSTLDSESSFGINDRITHYRPCRHLKVQIGEYGIIADDTFPRGGTKQCDLVILTSGKGWPNLNHGCRR